MSNLHSNNTHIVNMTLQSFWHAALAVSSLPYVTSFGLLGRAAFARPHVILEGPDGVGKTTLVEHVKYHEKYLVEKDFRYKFVKEPYGFDPDTMDVDSMDRTALRAMFKQDRADFWYGRRASVGDFYFMDRSSLSMAVYNEVPVKECIEGQDFWYPLADRKTWVVFVFTSGRNDMLSYNYMKVSREASELGLNVLNIALTPNAKVESVVKQSRRKEMTDG